ncbi:MAG: hypothetical protein IJC56_08130 [Clostridia bacterium]|nr:hypothetical protein [Clostridia bacterium]
MKCSVFGVFLLGAALGGASAMALAASDPAIRHRMYCKARYCGRKAMRTAEHWMR